MTLQAFTDGASRGNPGESGIGILVRKETGETVLSLSGSIGKTTNNIAEYMALLTLLEYMRTIECTRLVVYSDSELMVRQINGQYKVKDKTIRKYHRRIHDMFRSLHFAVEVRYIPRDQNAEADRLANQGIDSRQPLPALAVAP